MLDFLHSPAPGILSFEVFLIVLSLPIPLPHSSTWPRSLPTPSEGRQLLPEFPTCRPSHPSTASLTVESNCV